MSKRLVSFENIKKLLMSQCFVGGVHYDIGMKDIREAFAPFGVIKTVDLNVDPLTGRHKVSSRGHFHGIR